ncbi:MAG: metallopeptidase family protein [Dehalococcoidales bacterium]|nr:metallopeptidase family protein [Dehalococcoidales bacterium]
MDKLKFENLVAQAVEELPLEFREMLTNIDVVVEDAPSREQLRQSRVGRGYTLLGLYQGIPLTERHSSYGMVPPDKITIFQKTIEARCAGRSESLIREEIGKVVRHEIAHHFGIGDDRLQEIEKGEG